MRIRITRGPWWNIVWGSFMGLVLALAVLTVPVGAQGSLSNQVLALLTRVNSWTATQTFFDLRVANQAIPSVTTYRIYADPSGNLYFNGGLIAGAGGGVTPHNILSTTHADTLTGSVARAAVIVGNSTPKWALVQPSVTGSVLLYNGTDTVFSTSGAALTALNAANLTGTSAAIVGTAITALNASNLTSGTVPLAQLANITTTQIAAGAAIPYSKLALTGTILNADISASAAIVYSKLALTGLVVTGDLTAGTLLFDRWASNGCTNTQVPRYNGSAWVCRTLVIADIVNGGTVTSVAITTPAILSVAGSPVTTTGTLALSLATQTANQVWAGPTGGGAVTPTFRALVNADFPLTGVGAGTYAKVTVNTAGLVTAATAQASLTADVSGILPMANGGTGVGVSADDSVLIGSGAAWVARTLPDCPTGSLAYTQATNLFNCSSTVPGHNILSATHTDSVVAASARGAMIVGDATPNWARVTLGTAGQGWSVNGAGTDPSWSNTVARGTVLASSPWTWTQTWNNAGVTFQTLLVQITNTASAAASTLIDLQVGGVSQFNVTRTGIGTFATSVVAPLVTVDSTNITISTTTSGDIQLTPFGDVRWNKALVALGGGAAPTFGTIGGSGPAAAAQNSWMRVKDSTGAAFWVPAWK